VAASVIEVAQHSLAAADRRVSRALAQPIPSCVR
jgi:hypothetical protein